MSTPDVPFIAGSRAYARVVGQDRWWDMGNIQPIGQENNPTLLDRYGSWGGYRRKLEQRATEIQQTFTITGDSFHPDIWAMLMQADEVEAWTQVATQQTDVMHAAVADGLVKLYNADGTPAFHLASVDGVDDDDGAGAPGSALVLGTDWRVHDLRTGFIEIDSAATITDGKIHVTFTPTLVASAKRLIRPLTVTKPLEVDMFLFWSIDNFDSVWVRELRASLVPQNPTFSDSEWSTWQAQATVISDLTDSVEPAGTFVQFMGTVPTYDAAA